MAPTEIPAQSGNPHYRPAMTTEQAFSLFNKMSVGEKHKFLGWLKGSSVRITDTDITFPVLGSR